MVRPDPMPEPQCFTSRGDSDKFRIMSQLFRDARLKVRRASKHIADLEAAISMVPLASIDGIMVQRPDGEIIRGFAGASQSLPPYVIPFDKNIRIKEKGKLNFNIVLKEAGIYGSVHIMEVLPTFSRVVSNYIGLLERI
jgi:hypothetical protein